MICTFEREGIEMGKNIGILTAGGDAPALNAAIRGLGKAAIERDHTVIGFRDGFRGLMEDNKIFLDSKALSGILSLGGTILGTSRDKPHKMMVYGKRKDMTDVIVKNCKKNNLDVLVCLGGGGTHKNAFHLAKHGINVITLPKTIDNDLWGTDVTLGFDTALEIATEAVDRLHSTAHSHHRIIVVEIMGHNAGWLALGAGLAGGADVILIPEIPYSAEAIADAIRGRNAAGKNFSIVSIAEGAMSIEQAKEMHDAQALREAATEKSDKKAAKAAIRELEAKHKGNTQRLVSQLEDKTGLEARLTILGHVQRGGTPSATDRLLASCLGSAAADLIEQEKYGVMVAVRGDGTEAIPLEDVVGKRKVIPLEHPWILTARGVGTCLGY